MSNTDGPKPEAEIEKALSDLNVEMHVPAEILLAYAQGELSGEVAARIASHVRDCAACHEVLDCAKQSATWAKEAEAQAAGSDLPIRLPTNMEPKLQWVTTVNQKRSDIAVSVARLLLPEDSWDSIALIVKAAQEWPGKVSRGRSETGDVSLEAAFGAVAGRGERRRFEIISQAADFANLVGDLVSERGQDIGDLEELLPDCVAEAILVLKAVEPDEDLRRKLIGVVLQNLSQNGTT